MSDTSTTQEPAHAGLDQLAAQAAAVDQQLAGTAAPGAPDAQAQAEKEDVAQEVAAMLHMGAAMLAPALPFLPACYTPEACGRIGTAFAAVAEKRGWQMRDVMTPELALCVVALPPTIQAVMMGRAHFAKKAPPADGEQQQLEPQQLEAQNAVQEIRGQEGIRVMPAAG